MKCWQCHQPAPGGVCVRPHEDFELERAISNGHIDLGRPPAWAYTGLTPNSPDVGSGLAWRIHGELVLLGSRPKRASWVKVPRRKRSITVDMERYSA